MGVEEEAPPSPLPAPHLQQAPASPLPTPNRQWEVQFPGTPPIVFLDEEEVINLKNKRKLELALLQESLKAQQESIKAHQESIKAHQAKYEYYTWKLEHMKNINKQKQ